MNSHSTPQQQHQLAHLSGVLPGNAQVIALSQYHLQLHPLLDCFEGQFKGLHLSSTFITYSIVRPFVQPGIVYHASIVIMGPQECRKSSYYNAMSKVKFRVAIKTHKSVRYYYY